MITNKQRLLYLLDILAEPFSESAKNYSCGCGGDNPDNPTEKKLRSEDIGSALMAIEGPIVCKRDLIDAVLVDAYNMENKTKYKSLSEVLEQLNDQQVKEMLPKNMDFSKVDRNLEDIALFIDVNRPKKTTFEEIKAWDARHRNDFINQLEF